MVNSALRKEIVRDITGGLLNVVSLDGDAHQLRHPHDPSVRITFDEAYAVTVQNKNEGLRQLVNAHDANVTADEQVMDGAPPPESVFRRQASTELAAFYADVAFRVGASTALTFTTGDSGTLLIGVRDGKIADKTAALENLRDALVERARDENIDEPSARRAIGKLLKQQIKTVDLPDLPD